MGARSKRKVLSVIAAIITAALVFWLLRSPWSESGVLYRGTASDGVQVFLLLRKGATSVPPELQFSDGRAYWLRLPESKTDVGELQPWMNHGAVEVGTNESITVGRTNGFIALGVAQRGHVQTVALERIGRELTRRTSSGWRFRSYGLTSETELSVLELAETNAAGGALDALRLANSRQTGDLGSVSWRDIMDGIRNPYFGNAHRYSSRLMPVHLQGNAVSLLEVYYDYTGGAHGNTTLLVHNLYLCTNGWVEIDLDNLFLPGSAWRERLNARVREGLISLGASVDNQLPEDEAQDLLGEYAVTSTGLVFFFSPYEVASYAQGCFAVFVSCSDLADCLDTNGPLQHFLAK